MVAADLNGQPGLDLATANSSDGTISILPNLGNGSFGAPLVHTVDSGSTTIRYDITAADFDGDGVIDLAISGYHHR